MPRTTSASSGGPIPAAWLRTTAAWRVERCSRPIALSARAPKPVVTP